MTAGESHGKGLIGIIEGIPAGMHLTEEYIAKDLFRRMQGHGRGKRMKIEKDYAEIFLTYGDQNGLMQVNWITPIRIRSLAVTGTKGYAELNYMTQDLKLYESNYYEDHDNFGDFIIKFGTD